MAIQTETSPVPIWIADSKVKQQTQASDTYVVRGRVVRKKSRLVKLMTHGYRAD